MHDERLISSGNRSDRPGWMLKVSLVLFVGALQMSNFYLGYKLYAVMQPLTYIDLETAVDRYIPYISWTYVVYYFGLAYVVLWGAAGIWRMPHRLLFRTIAVYSALVLVGAGLHLIFPTYAPWPLVENLSAAQRAFKSGMDIEPVACFPSMHVAMSILPAYICSHMFQFRTAKAVAVILAVLISVSIVTAKEHWFVDAVSGAVLGILAGMAWRRYAHKSLPGDIHSPRSETHSCERVRAWE